jgi:Family of unknown function (DUF6228)
VDCVYDAEAGEDTALSMGEPQGPWVRLWNRLDPWGDGSVEVCAELASGSDNESLTATAHGVRLGVMGETLSGFLGDLAEDFAGWAGVRGWKTLDGDLEVAAEHVSGGYVDLTWTLSASMYSRRPRWTASVVVRAEAGEQMRRLAASMYRLLNPAQRH